MRAVKPCRALQLILIWKMKSAPETILENAAGSDFFLLKKEGKLFYKLIGAGKVTFRIEVEFWKKMKTFAKPKLRSNKRCQLLLRILFD